MERNTATMNGTRKMIVKKAIKQFQDECDEEIRPGHPKFDDLMVNIENQVTTVLEENR